MTHETLNFNGNDVAQAFKMMLTTIARGVLFAGVTRVACLAKTQDKFGQEAAIYEVSYLEENVVAYCLRKGPEHTELTTWLLIRPQGMLIAGPDSARAREFLRDHPGPLAAISAAKAKKEELLQVTH